MSSRIGYFLRFSRNAAFVDRSFRSTPLLYTSSETLQARSSNFLTFFLRVLQHIGNQQLVSRKKVMGAYPRLAYIRYTRARKAAWGGLGRMGRPGARPGSCQVAVAWQRSWPGGRSPHMILLYQVMHGTRNIARICRVSNRAKSPKIG